MTRTMTGRISAAAAVIALSAGVALAHITPPVVLVSDRDVLLALLAGAQRFFVREIRLSGPERASIKQRMGFAPDEDFYRFYLGRDAGGRLVAATIFVTEFTLHGPVRVAVALGPDGRVRGATVVELTEETYPWVRPLLDQGFTRDYVGRDSRARFGLSDRITKAHLDSMPRFYGEIIASLIQRATLLFEVGVLKRGDVS